jgi:DNA gyrase subunit A
MEKEVPKEGKVVQRIIEEEMQASYIDYAMSVIVSRALPDVKDGLKPVHRRILFAMHNMGMFHNKPFKKSARIVGEVLGKYHPHGDAAVYDSMVRMVQSFSLRYPLINGQGNFGSIDGDSAAAMRYTEARLRKISEDMLKDIEKKTVKFRPNFDASLTEPTVLPSKIPNLLVNGSSGIAVGMATNIPPHNMVEVCNGLIRIVDNPEVSVEELMNIVTAPDFPTGGIICGIHGVKRAYKTGRGKVIVRAKTNLEEKKNRSDLIITEIPYQVNKTSLIEEIADLVRQKKVTGIRDIRDESDRSGMRIVVELRTGANSDVLLNQLYKYTRMQTTFGVITLALVDNEPKVLNLKEVMVHYLNHRKKVIRNRAQFDLNKAEEKAHILDGLIVALDSLDNTIKMIKESKSVEEARNILKSSLSITGKQAQAILEMKLQRLTSLEQNKIRKDRDETLKIIEELKSILASDQKIAGIIKDDLTEVMQNYGDERRTQIIAHEEIGLDMEDLIKPEDMVVTITHAGYIKRVSLGAYKEQKRGGKGIIAAGTKEGDFIEDIFIANTHAYLLFFTDKGKVHWLKVHQIPEASRQAKGTAIVNLLGIDKDEKITAFVSVKHFRKDRYVVMVTKGGIIKRTSLEAFSHPRKGGILAVGLNEGDELISVKLTNGERNLTIATAQGMAIRFNEKDVRIMGRTATGVRGIKLRKDDGVIGMVRALEGKSIFTVTEKGYGKRTPVEDYRLINRGGVGVINLKITEKNGKVVSIKSVTDDDGLMLISKEGITIRMAAEAISIIGRNTQGVRVMKIAKEDTVVSAAKVPREEPEQLEEHRNNGNGGSGRDPESTDENLETVDQEEMQKKAAEQTEEKVPTLDDLRKKAKLAKGRIKSLWKG